MSFFKVTISGTEQIEKELATNITEAENIIPIALQEIGNDMVLTLQKHLKEDWYNRYSPKEYKRRTDNPSLGTPLSSTENMDIEVQKNKLTFTYEPTGEHANNAWHERDGDELINWLQTSHDKIPARPFWNNFIDEEPERIADILSKALKKVGVANINASDIQIDFTSELL